MNKPFYNFPTLKADLVSLCATGLNQEFKPALIGKAYCFDWEKARDEANVHRTTLDRSLAFDLAKGFKQNTPKSPVLVWFGVSNRLVFLWVTGNKGTAYAHWMSESAGFCESGQDYLHPTAVPFLYWDGLYSHRVYRVDSDILDKAYWVQDLGNLLVTTITAASQEDFERIKSDPVKHFDYSAISPEIEMILRKGERRVAMSQALIDLVNNPLIQS